MKYLAIVLLVFSATASAGEFRTQEEAAQYLISLENKFEKVYPRANLILVYCRAQLLADSGEKITEEVMERFYRSSDANNESALSLAKSRMVTKDVHCLAGK